MYPHIKELGWVVGMNTVILPDYFRGYKCYKLKIQYVWLDILNIITDKDKITIISPNEVVGLQI